MAQKIFWDTKSHPNSLTHKIRKSQNLILEKCYFISRVTWVTFRAQKLFLGHLGTLDPLWS